MEQINNIEQGKSLAEQITDIVKAVNFGESVRVVPIDNADIYNRVKNSVTGMDSRAKIDSSDTTESVFEGLAFDPEKRRSQSFAIFDVENLEGGPVGVMTMVITPKVLLEKDKFWEVTRDGVAVRDYSDLLEKVDEPHEMPDFVISPAWTKVDPKYAGKFAISGFRSINNILDFLVKEAPDNTFISVSAQGTEDMKVMKNSYALLTSVNVGDQIPDESVYKLSNIKDFSNLIGKNTPGSNSTVKFAGVLGLKTVPGYGTQESLGPVFIKKIK